MRVVMVVMFVSDECIVMSSAYCVSVVWSGGVGMSCM